MVAGGVNQLLSGIPDLKNQSACHSSHHITVSKCRCFACRAVARHRLLMSTDRTTYRKRRGSMLLVKSMGAWACSMSYT
jgi:hypothetical protein